MALTSEQAQQALSMGLISQDTFNKIVPAPMSQPAVEQPAVVQPEIIDPAQVRRDQALDFAASLVPESTVDRLRADQEARKNYLEQQVPSPLAMPQDRQPQAVEAPVEVEAPAPSEPVQPIVPEEEIKKEVETGIKEAAYQTGVSQGFEIQQQKYEERLRNIQKQKEEARQKSVVDLQKADEEAAKLEPKDFWADKSTGTRLAAAIAMGLGAYASAMTGGPNTAMQIIDNAIQRDLSLQKEKYQRAKDKRATIKSALADQVALLGDEEAAEASLLNNAYKKFEMQLRAAEAKTTNQVQKLNAQKLIQEIELKKQESEAKRQERLVQLQLAKGLKSGEQINPELLPEKDRKRYISDPNFGGLARSENAANKVSESLIEYRTAKDLLSVLREIQATPGKSISPEQRSKAETAAAALKGKLRGPIVGPGAVSESEWTLLNNIVKNPTDFFSLDNVNRERLNSIDRILDGNMSQTAKAYMTTPVKDVRNANTMTTIRYSVPGTGQVITKDVTPSELEKYRTNAKKMNIAIEELK